MSNDVQWQIFSAVISLASFILCALSWLIALSTATTHRAPTMESFAMGCSSSGLALSPRGLGIHIIAMGVCGTLFIVNVVRYYKNRKSDDEENAIVLARNRHFNEKNCHRCSILFDSIKDQKRILCIKCNQYVCKGCSKWDPKCQTRNCKSCVGTDQSHSPEWIHSKLLERCRRFESAKKLMAMQKGSDEYDNDIENDSGYNGPCISPVDSSDTAISRKKAVQDGENGSSSYYGGNDIDPSALYLHEHIENIVEQLIGDSLDEVTLEPIVQNPEYERMIEIYHRRISDALSQLIQSIQQAQANMELASDQTPTSTHSALKYIINELIEESKELPLLVNCSTQSSAMSSTYLFKDDDFEEQSYEEILSTAIINRVIEKYQKSKNSKRFGEPFGDIDDRFSVGSRTSSVSNKEIQTDLEFIPVPLPRKIRNIQLTSSSPLTGVDSIMEITTVDGVAEDFSWAKDIAMRSPPLQYMIEEQIEEIVTTVKNIDLNRTPGIKQAVNEPLIGKTSLSRLDAAPDLDSLFVGFDFVQSHRVPFPEFGGDICQAADGEGPSSVEEDDHLDTSEETMLMAIIDNWEKNWLFRKKKSISPFRNLGDFLIGEEPVAMLVPNPQEGVKVRIGNRDIDELSDMSEKNVEDDILELDSPINDNSEITLGSLDFEDLANKLTTEENQEEDETSESKDDNANVNRDFSLDEYTVDAGIYKPVIPTLSISAPLEDSLSSSLEDCSSSRMEDSLFSKVEDSLSSKADDLLSSKVDVLLPSKVKDPLSSKVEDSSSSKEEESALSSEEVSQTSPMDTTSLSKEEPAGEASMDIDVAITANKNDSDPKINETIRIRHKALVDTTEPLVNMSRPSVLPGTIAEREHKKWENAIQMPNNPYTAESIARRALERSTSFPGKSSSGPWTHTTEDTVLDTSNTVTKIDCGPKDVYLSKYQRDYFVNESTKKVNRAGSCPSRRPTSLIESNMQLRGISSLPVSPSTPPSNRNSLPDLNNDLLMEEFLEGKVARAVALANQNENEVSMIKQKVEQVRQDFIIRRQISVENASADQNSKVVEDGDRASVPTPSPRTSRKKMNRAKEIPNGQHDKSPNVSQDTIIEETKGTKGEVVCQTENSPVRRVHSLTARCLSKEFRQSALQNTPRQPNRNSSVFRENKYPTTTEIYSQPNNTSVISKPNFNNGYNNDSLKICDCEQKRKAEQKVIRCPWVESNGCGCNSVAAANGKHRRKVSSAIASRADFWDRRVRENRMTDLSMCDEFPSMDRSKKNFSQ